MTLFQSDVIHVYTCQIFVLQAFVRFSTIRIETFSGILFLIAKHIFDDVSNTENCNHAVIMAHNRQIWKHGDQLFRVRDAGWITIMPDGTELRNTCSARSIATAISLTYYNQDPCPEDRIRRWIGYLRCDGNPIELEQYTQTIRDNLPFGLRLDVYLLQNDNQLYLAERYARVVSDPDTTPYVASIGYDRNMIIEGQAPDEVSGHFVVLIPDTEGDAESAPQSESSEFIPSDDNLYRLSLAYQLEQTQFKLNNGLNGLLFHINALGHTLKSNPEGIEFIHVPCRGGKTLIILYRMVQAMDMGRSVILFLYHPEIAACTQLYNSLRGLLIHQVGWDEKDVDDRLFHISKDRSMSKGKGRELADKLRSGTKRVGNDDYGRCLVVTLNDAKVKTVKDLFNWPDMDADKVEIFVDEPQNLWTGRGDNTTKKVELELNSLFECQLPRKLKLISATHLDTILLMQEMMDKKYSYETVTFSQPPDGHLDRLGYKGLETPDFIKYFDPTCEIESVKDLWDPARPYVFKKKVSEFFDDLVDEEYGYGLILGNVFSESDMALNVHTTAKRISHTMQGANLCCVGVSAAEATVYVEGNFTKRFETDKESISLPKSALVYALDHLDTFHGTEHWLVVSNRADYGSVDFRCPDRTISHVIMAYNKYAEIQRKSQGVGRATGYNITHRVCVMSSKKAWEDFIRAIIDGQKALVEHFGKKTIPMNAELFQAMTRLRFGAPKSIAGNAIRKRAKKLDDESARKRQYGIAARGSLAERIFDFFDAPEGRTLKEMREHNPGLFSQVRVQNDNILLRLCKQGLLERMYQGCYRTTRHT